MAVNKKLLHKQETDETAQESFGDTDGPTIIYSEEELNAMREVRAKLLEEHGIEPSRVGSTFLAVATINCKLRVDETTSKIVKLLEIMEQLGCEDGIDDELWKPNAKHELKPYAPTGTDHRGCSITWIQAGGNVPKNEERAHVHACIMQYLSVHADPTTLREGVSFIIDMSNGGKAQKIGNEKLIQSFYQSIPQRPQIILIAGTSFVTRTIVNASIKLASVFTKQKILQRIHFVTVEEAKNMFPRESAPVCVGGEGGGIERYEDWVEERLGLLPKPNLSEDVSNEEMSANKPRSSPATITTETSGSTYSLGRPTDMAAASVKPNNVVASKPLDIPNFDKFTLISEVSILREC